MRFHKVEVDDEVFQYIQNHAEPLVDTFNSVLRRLILTPDSKPDKSKQEIVSTIRTDGFLPDLPNHTPKALRHIIEVATLVHDRAYDRPSATRYVAKQHNVNPQTVLDKYCRQINLNTKEFDRLLEQPELTDLKKILKSKFPGYSQLIDEILM